MLYTHIYGINDEWENISLNQNFTFVWVESTCIADKKGPISFLGKFQEGNEHKIEKEKEGKILKDEGR